MEKGCLILFIILIAYSLITVYPKVAIVIGAIFVVLLIVLPFLLKKITRKLLKSKKVIEKTIKNGHVLEAEVKCSTNSTPHDEEMKCNNNSALHEEVISSAPLKEESYTNLTKEPIKEELNINSLINL